MIKVKCVECRLPIADMITANVIRIPMILCKECYNKSRNLNFSVHTDKAEENEDCSHELHRVLVSAEWAYQPEWVYQCQKCEKTFYILPCKLKK